MKLTSETKRFRVRKKGRVEFCISMMLPSSRSYGLLRTDGHGCFPTDGFFAISNEHKTATELHCLSEDKILISRDKIAAVYQRK